MFTTDGSIRSAGTITSAVVVGTGAGGGGVGAGGGVLGGVVGCTGGGGGVGVGGVTGGGGGVVGLLFGGGVLAGEVGDGGVGAGGLTGAEATKRRFSKLATTATFACVSSILSPGEPADTTLLPATTLGLASWLTCPAS